MLRPRWIPFSLPIPWVHRMAFVVWACVAYSVVAFALHWSVSVSDGPALASAAQPPTLPDVDAAAVSKALGADAAQPNVPSLASRFVLVGVLDGGPQQGTALIAVDGKPAKPYRVGQTVVEGLAVIATAPKKAELGAQIGAVATLVLELPVRK